ncbi:Transposase IS4 [Popillia japonica]|uniref:Transposase IS4 n=1 Tax=Popillia japonica TaxID=7064 RepID=A0AAW1M0X6_POPJA
MLKDCSERNISHFKEMRNIAKRTCRNCKRQYLDNMLRSVETHYQAKNIRNFYQEAKKNTQGKMRSLKYCRNEPGESTKYFTDDELHKILNEGPNLLESNEFDNPDDDDSDEEEEIIETNNDESETELECSDDDKFDKLDLASGKRNEYFRGRNKQTLWSKSSYQSTKTKSKNIVKMFPGPKAAAKNIVDEIVAFNKIIDTKMIDEIVRCTNLYIQYKKGDVQYSRNKDAKDTSRAEIMALLELLYLPGSKKLNRTNVLEIWTTDGTGMEMVRAVMSYKRFSSMSSFR